MNIDKLSTGCVSGKYSVAVDEFRWFTNGWTLSKLSQGQYNQIYFFEDKLLNNKDLNSLTLRIAIHLY